MGTAGGAASARRKGCSAPRALIAAPRAVRAVPALAPTEAAGNVDDARVIGRRRGPARLALRACSGDGGDGRGLALLGQVLARSEPVAEVLDERVDLRGEGLREREERPVGSGSCAATFTTTPAFVVHALGPTARERPRSARGRSTPRRALAPESEPW